MTPTTKGPTTNGPDRAMVLAAGLGTRMRPITETTPKPLIEVGGRSLIDHCLDRLDEAGVETVVVNTHHMADKLERHLKQRERPVIEFSREEKLLETGGGVKKALDLLGAGAFYVLNSDMLLLNGPQSALRRLADEWDDTRMDGLLLLHSTVSAQGYVGLGDFGVDSLGRIERRREREVTPFMFTGTQILHPRLFDNIPETEFSLNLVYDRALAGRRLYGVIHDGECFHVGTVDGLAAAGEFLQELYPGRRYR